MKRLLSLAVLAIASAAQAEPFVLSAQDGFGYVVDSTDGYVAADSYCRWIGYSHALSYRDLDFCKSAGDCQSTKGWKPLADSFFFSQHVTRYLTRVDCALPAPSEREQPIHGKKVFASVRLATTDGRSFRVGGQDLGGSALQFCAHMGYTGLVAYEGSASCQTGPCPYAQGYLWAVGQWRFSESLTSVLKSVTCSNP